MEKKKSRKRYNLFQIIMCTLLSFFCAFSFWGCVPSYGGGSGSSSSSGSSSGGSSSGGSSSGGSSSGGSSSGSSSGSSGSGSGSSSSSSNNGKLEHNSIEDLNDAIMGVIGVYDITGTEEIFYDKHGSNYVSFDYLVNRHFTAMATYIYKSLNRIYGTSTDSSFNISGYGTNNKSVAFSNVINSATQKTISGLHSSTLKGSEYLNYKNSINGGYDLVATSSTDEESGETTYSYAYDTAVTLRDNAWKSADILSVEATAISTIAQNLAFIYANYKDWNISINKSIDISDITFNTNHTLKDTYMSFSAGGSYVINSLGIDNDFIWHVAYYIAFTLIGDAQITNSISTHESVINGSSIKNISYENHSMFEKYKGYHIVVKELAANLEKMYINGNSMSFKSNPEDVTWDITPFPAVNKERYIYYDNINEVCDAYNEDLLEHKVGTSDSDDDSKWDDEDFDDENFDDENFDESEFDKIDSGSSYKLKQLIILPHIDTTKLTGITEYELGGFMVGFKNTTEDSLQVSCSVSFYTDDDVDTQPGVVSEGDNVKDNIITFDHEYLLSEDIVSIDFNQKQCLTSIDETLKTAVESSFRNNTKTVSYAEHDSLSFTIGELNVYNPLVPYLQENDGWTNNVVTLDFVYHEVSEIPETYLMYFYLYEYEKCD